MSEQQPPKRPTEPSVSRKRATRTLGPLADLEAHLPSEWWQDLFDSLYLKTDGDVVENDTNTSREVDMLVAATGIEPDQRLLDLCCGQGRHSIELARRGFQNVTGVDRSRYLVRLARRRAKRANLAVTFREGDARRLGLPENAFDCVAVMGNSFGYFDQKNDDLKLVESAKRVLRSGGTLALDLADGEWIRQKFEPRSWEWIDQHHFVCRERSLSNDGERLITREVITHAERGVIADQFYAERLYSVQDIEALLAQAGFRQFRIHGPVHADSDRGHDLGMMAKRFFVTASAPRKASAGLSGKGPIRVTVVMGDPRLPDAVKREGQFNPEDFDTINRLKKALGELNGYIFDYLDNHETLYNDLGQRPPDLVFNICDEGFNNNALMELHVPAILEALNIPYTGAGPASLGLCYDKALVRAIASANAIPVPLETFVAVDDHSATIPSAFPVLLKPSLGDSSVGITKDAVVHSAEQLVAYLGELRKTMPGRPVLVQEFLPGAEYSVALVGNPGSGLEALPVLEVDYGKLDRSLPKILGYESKWIPESPYWTQISYRAAELPADSHRQLVEQCKLLFERLGCRDYARFDFRADAEGEIKLLEVNPNPGWCWDGKLNLMAGFRGTTYAELLKSILEAALQRIRFAESDAAFGRRRREVVDTAVRRPAAVAAR